MDRAEGTVSGGNAAIPGRSGRQAGAREREADERERLQERGARLRQQAAELRAQAARAYQRAVQALEQAEAVLEAAEDRARRAEAAVTGAYVRAARERAGDARSAQRGEQYPDPRQHDFADLADYLSALRKKTAAAAARFAEVEEHAARVHDERASSDPGNPEHKRQASEARQVMRRDRETEGKYTSS
jgi:hypothetical protein